MATHEDHNVLQPWASLDITKFSVALGVFGFYLVTIGQLSYLIKARLLMSSALLALCVGIAVGPIGLDWISPWQWTSFDEEERRNLTFQITRVVIGIQVMFAGIDLPAAYLRREARSLFMLLGPIMTAGWFISAGFILLFVPALTFLEALAISACITPTDPILANAIVKGRYAEKHVPKAVRDIISAESGANDGLGFPFLFIALNLMQGSNHGRDIGQSIAHWVVTTWLYQIFMSCAIGAVIGFLAAKTLKFCHARQLVDHESFLAYGVGLALFTLGVVGILGSDDILACFVAGNSLTWHDFYRIEKHEHEDTFQDVIDGLLDTATFIYIGALIPWSEFSSEYLKPWRLVLFAICILLFRRLPAMLLLYRYIPALEGLKEGLFAGWFGPIGVSALYYAILALETLPEERVVLREVIFPVVIFMAMSSTIVHGITIPLAKAPLAIARTKSSFSAKNDDNAPSWWRRRAIHEANSAGGTPTAGTPGPASRAPSRRPSFDGSASASVDGSVDGEQHERDGSHEGVAKGAPQGPKMAVAPGTAPVSVSSGSRTEVGRQDHAAGGAGGAGDGMEQGKERRVTYALPDEVPNGF
ncbi:hypothetical protein JCM9279_006769 [Rhodotorula babjevae]